MTVIFVSDTGFLAERMTDVARRHCSSDYASPVNPSSRITGEPQPFGQLVVGMNSDQHQPGGSGGVRFGGGGGGAGGVSPSKMFEATLPWPWYTYQYVWQTLSSHTTGL